MDEKGEGRAEDAGTLEDPGCVYWELAEITSEMGGKDCRMGLSSSTAAFRGASLPGIICEKLGPGRVTGEVIVDAEAME